MIVCVRVALVCTPALTYTYAWQAMMIVRSRAACADYRAAMLAVIAREMARKAAREAKAGEEARKEAREAKAGEAKAATVGEVEAGGAEVDGTEVVGVATAGGVTAGATATQRLRVLVAFSGKLTYLLTN